MLCRYYYSYEDVSLASFGNLGGGGVKLFLDNTKAKPGENTNDINAHILFLLNIDIYMVLWCDCSHLMLDTM